MGGDSNHSDVKFTPGEVGNCKMFGEKVHLRRGLMICCLLTFADTVRYILVMHHHITITSMGGEVAIDGREVF